MKVDAYKCSECNFLTVDEEKYNKHILNHLSEQRIEEKFPSVDNTSCKFSNGGFSVKRDKKWLDSYKELIEKEAKRLEIEYEPWSYAWFRCLDDGSSFLYKFACRFLNVCPVCLREWGQGYYAKNCKHGD